MQLLFITSLSIAARVHRVKAEVRQHLYEPIVSNPGC
jgi:hypothetical protein